MPPIPPDLDDDQNDDPSTDTQAEGLEQEGMGGAPEAAPTQICVPVAALAEPDAGDQMNKPAVGDKIQASIEGTIDKIEGENAYITLETVNGQEIEGPEAPATEQDQMSQLQGMAEQMPERY